MEPNRELNQVGSVPLVLTFDHQYLLEPADGGTRIVQHEVYRGLGVWSGTRLGGAGVRRVNDALGSVGGR